MEFDAFTNWRAAPDADLSAEIERIWRLGQFTTLGIAALLGVPEARVYNLRARAEAARAA